MSSTQTLIPANSPSLVRSLRHFRLASISVRGDRNLRHLRIGFFSFFFRFPAIISYFPVIIPISVVGKEQRWRLDEVGRHVQEIKMQMFSMVNTICTEHRADLAQDTVAALLSVKVNSRVDPR